MKNNSPGLPVHRVLPALGTILFQLKPVGSVLLVLFGDIISGLAHSARQNYVVSFRLF